MDKTNLLIMPSSGNIDEVINGLSQNIGYTSGSSRRVEFIIKNNSLSILHDQTDLNNFSSIWLSSTWGTRDLAYAMKLYLDHHNIEHTYVEKSTSKVTDQVMFALNGINVPDTYYIDSKNILKYIERIEEVCSYPLIVKDINGSGGKHSAHITNREELLKEYNSLPKHKKYMFQSYIVNDYDWGVMVANGRIVSAEKSYKLDGEFRNNAAQGAEEVFVKAGEIPENIKEIASRASEALKLTWSRSDILIQKDTGKAFLLEVNRFPGITSGSTEVTGAQQFIMSHLNSIQD